jgi:anaerobic selenocysteine-containing dehydrogenase
MGPPQTTNEPAFLLQLFAREFGTNNLPDCSNMCHESSGVAMVETLGIGKGTATLEDMESTGSHLSSLETTPGQTIREC